jgi:hypothetical protein
MLGPPKLSPIGKRSFDTWSGSEYDEDGESSPCKMERLDSFYDEGDQMKVHLFDENEIINLPTSDKSSNKHSIHLQARTRPRKNSGSSSASFRKSKPKHFSAFSLKDYFKKDKGHLGAASPEKKDKPVRSNSWTGAMSLPLLLPQIPKRIEIPVPPDEGSPSSVNSSSTAGEFSSATSQVSEEQFTAAVGPFFYRDNRCDSVSSDCSEVSVEPMSDYQDFSHQQFNNTDACLSTKVIGIGMTELDNEISELDLSAVVLDVNENTMEWQHLVILTPTSRNRPSNPYIKTRKSISVPENIFEEDSHDTNPVERMEPVLQSSIATKLFENRDNGKPLNIILDKSHQKIIISSPRHHQKSRLSTPKNAKQPIEQPDLMDMILAQESTDSLFNFIESLDPAMVSVDVVDDEDDEIFRFLNKSSDLVV